jgi:expansin (peptidoglycan-binding protein)
LFFVATFILLLFNPKSYAQCDGGTEDHGHGTWYVNLEETDHPLYTGVVRCSFQRDDIVGTRYGALDQGMLQEDGDAKYCGMCVEATGPNGSAVIQIVDECPDCWDRSASGQILTGTNTKFGDIDLSPAAFADVVGSQDIGIGDFDWKEVSCPWATPIDIIVEGSNQWYAKVIISNHTNRVAKVEVQQESSWFDLSRGEDNGWVSTGVTLNEASKSFKITDIYGSEVIVTGIDFTSNPTDSKTAGRENFPACGLVSSGNLPNTLDYVTVFPNPSNSRVTFDGVEDVKSIEIVNVNGQILASRTFDRSMAQVGLDISSFPLGIYVAKLTGSNKTGVVTFVKK